MSRRLEFFCGVWSKKSEQKAVSVIREVQPFGACPGADDFQLLKCSS
jgi:hypothetical protein